MVNLRNIPTKKKSSLFAKIFFLALALVLISSTTILATRVWDPFWNPFRPNPKIVLLKSISETTKIKTAHTKINIGLKIIGNDQVSSVKAQFEGDNDFSDLLNIKTDTIFSIIANPGKNVFSGNLKIVDKKVYLNAKGIDLSAIEPFLISNGTDLDKIKNLWVDLSYTANLSAIKNIELPNSYDFFDVKSQLPDEVFDGQKTYHYVVAINNPKLATVLAELSRDSLQKSGMYENVDITINAIKEGIENILSNIGQIDIDVFIGKKDNYIYKVAVNKNIDLPSLVPFLEGVVTIDLEVNNSRFNQPVVIEAPVNAKKVEEIYPEIKNSAVITSMSYLKEDINKVYSDEGSYKNINCDNDLLASDCNKIQKDLGAVLKINKTDKKYCAYVALFGSPTKYECIDNTNMNVVGSITTSINPAKYGYCSGASYKCPLADK